MRSIFNTVPSPSEAFGFLAGGNSALGVGRCRQVAEPPLVSTSNPLWDADVDSDANPRFLWRRRGKRKAAALLHDDPRLSTLSRRLNDCGAHAHAESVELVRVADAKGVRAAFTGVRRCHSVWCCPECSNRAAGQRKNELDALLIWARANGYTPLLLSLTFRHGRAMQLGISMKKAKLAKRMLRQSEAWRSLKALLVGSVTTTEITHGLKNGWHPHFHELLLIKLPADQGMALVNALLPEWLRCLKRAGLTGGSAALNVQDASVAGAYVAKFGAGEEMALSSTKEGRAGSRTPWQLLMAACRGDTQAAALWVEYARAVHGLRQLVWSPGLKAASGVADGDDDENTGDLVGEDSEPAPGRVVTVLRTWGGKSQGWLDARQRSASLLHAAETGGDLDAAEFGPSDYDRWCKLQPVLHGADAMRAKMREREESS